jgi:TorA maturation chaperone TorD
VGATSEQRLALAQVARLFSRLLLFELDAASLAELQEPGTARALANLGVQLPERSDRETLDDLAAEYFATFLQPTEGGPPVQSLWTGGQYEGDAAVEVRQLAEVAGLELNRDLARGAAPDHLGCLLWLWAETVEVVPEGAEAVAQRHLAWAQPCLARAGAREGFYAQLARAVGALVGALTVTASGPR